MIYLGVVQWELVLWALKHPLTANRKETHTLMAAHKLFMISVSLWAPRFVISTQAWKSAELWNETNDPVPSMPHSRPASHSIQDWMASVSLPIDFILFFQTELAWYLKIQQGFSVLLQCVARWSLRLVLSPSVAKWSHGEGKAGLESECFLFFFLLLELFLTVREWVRDVWDLRSAQMGGSAL